MGALSVSNLSKGYKTYPNRWARLAEWLDPRGRSRHAMHWVLRDLNFTVAAGEAVGIIGTNGAGKSTLLKLITGTIQPTHGAIAIKGQVAALLELGIGFHPDFTGRQNAILAGQLLGHSAAMMEGLIPAIADFAEIGDYLDLPVRFYSSGMQMRLAFSVATATRPDILIVDEALSVGDAYFQHKSFDRIRRFRAEGTTLLIVSHDRQAIQSICDRAILLDQQQIAFAGEPDLVMDYYNALLARHVAADIQKAPLSDGKTQIRSGNGAAEILTVRMRDTSGKERDNFLPGESARLEITLRANAEIPDLAVGYMIKDRLGQDMFGVNTHHLGLPIGTLASMSQKTVSFQFPVHLGPGHYAIAVALHAGADHMQNSFEWRERALMFQVTNTQIGAFVGSAWMPVEAEIKD